MAYEKVVGPVLLAHVVDGCGVYDNRLMEPTAATGHSHMRIAIKGVTDLNGSTFTPNPFSGTLFWDTMQYWLTGVSLAEACSYTVVVETDAIDGYTGLPIAGVSLSTAGSTGFVRIPNLHGVRCSPVPTHVNVIRTNAIAGTSEITFKLWGMGKASRGSLSTSGGKGKGSDHVLQGDIFRTGRALSVDALAVDSRFTLTTTGASGSFQGLNKMAQWDNAMFWLVGGFTWNGAWQAHIAGTIDGVTYIMAETIAKKLNGTSDAASHPWPKVPLFNYYGGIAQRPTELIITEVDVTAVGISDTRVVMIAKSNRGQYR